MRFSTTDTVHVRLRGSPAVTPGEMVTVGSGGAGMYKVAWLETYFNEYYKPKRKQHSLSTETDTVELLVSLLVTKPRVTGMTTASHLKLVLSSVLNGDRVRLLVNDLPDSANEMVTRLVVFDKGVTDLNQVTSIITSVSTSSLSVIVQVSVTEVVPAYSEPLGWTVTVTLGVGTREQKDYDSEVM